MGNRRIAFAKYAPPATAWYTTRAIVKQPVYAHATGVENSGLDIEDIFVIITDMASWTTKPTKSRVRYAMGRRRETI